MEKVAQKCQNFICSLCNIKCSKEYNWRKHLSTNKHRNRCLSNENQQTATNLEHLTCNKCNKTYKDRTGLWRHLKNHHKEENKIVEPLQNTPVLDSSMVLELIKQNQEFKTLLIEQQTKMLEQQNKLIELSSKPNNITNTNSNNNNKTFNLNVFLNETCKDAMNISDFIQNLNIQLQELENVGNNGYVTGISDIIVSRIKDLDVSKRPLHCTDVKRETMYIRDENEWNKDTTENSKLKCFIGKVAKENLKKIPEWREQNPECQNMYHQKYEYCMKLMRNSLGDLDEKQERMDDKIIKNIAKQVAIEKGELN